MSPNDRALSPSSMTSDAISTSTSTSSSPDIDKMKTQENNHNKNNNNNNASRYLKGYFLFAGYTAARQLLSMPLLHVQELVLIRALDTSSASSTSSANAITIIRQILARDGVQGLFVGCRWNLVRTLGIQMVLGPVVPISVAFLRALMYPTTSAFIRTVAHPERHAASVLSPLRVSRPWRLYRGVVVHHVQSAVFQVALMYLYKAAPKNLGPLSFVLVSAAGLAVAYPFELLERRMVLSVDNEKKPSGGGGG
eukprot:PhM_4_TR10796/c0_g1_i1/m.48964